MPATQKVIPQIPGCKLKRMVAQGGMGRVFSGVREHDGLAIAAKLPLLEMVDDPRFAAQLLHEEKALNKIHHPSVVGCLSSGTSAYGPYLLLEWIPGRNLGRHLEKHGPMTTTRAHEIFGDLIAAVAEVHEKGIVHSDLKSENIMMSPSYNGGLKPVLVDFGVAKIDGDWGVAGEVYGTPGYIAPEVLRGQVPTPASDVYALGGILYEILTGVRPFSGSADEIIAQQLEKDPPSLGQFCAASARRFDDFVTRTLQREPENRFSCAQEMLDAFLAIGKSGAAFIRSSRTLPASAATLPWVQPERQGRMRERPQSKQQRRAA